MPRLLPFLFVLAPALAAAQGAPRQASAQPESLAYGHKVAVPSVVAVKRNGPIVMDGKLDETAWQAARPMTDFRQIDPNEGEKGSQRTEVRFLYDDDALYVGAKMYDTEGAKGVMTRLVRRDGNFDSDYFELVIDSYHDHLSRAFFDLNPSGSKGDQIGIGTSCCDAGWDPVWEGVTHIDEDGWTAEIRIPYSQLRFPRAEVQTWGLQVRRFIKRNNEQDQWAWWGKTEAGGPPRFGHLEGLHIPSSTGHLELLPYVVSKSSSVADSPGDPFNTHGRPTMRAGLDLKDRLTSNLTLDATFNPDFGQVEVDPAVLNLSAFETFYQEKRPFFIEGSGVFDFGSAGCNFCSNMESMSAFYSRRIGRAPTGAFLATDVNRYADVPDATTIWGAGKITGRTSSGYTIGLLDAVTGQADARIETLAGARATQEVEPLANYFVARVKHDYKDGNLVVGAVASGLERNIDTTFAPLLARHAEMYGNDLVYTWDQQMYALQASASVTNVSGSPQEILLRQQSSARYLQRPDRGAGSNGFLSNRLDSNATSMRGAGLYTRVSKQTGDWFGELQTNIRTPGYETNDYAFQQRADYIWFNGNVGRTWTKPTNWYRQIVTIAGGQDQRNFEGDRTQQQLHAYWSETTPQFWNVTVFGIHRPAVIDDKALRGGPAVIAQRSDYAELDISSDSRTKLIGNLSLSRYSDALGGLNPGRVGERDLPAGVEREHVARTVVEPGAQPHDVRRRVSGQHRDGVLRNALRDLDPQTAHARPRHSAQRHLFADDVARAVHAAVLRGGTLLRLQGVRRAAHGHHGDVWQGPRHHHRDARRDRDGLVLHDRSGRHRPRIADHRSEPGLQRAVVARERRFPMGVPAGIRALRRVDSVSARGLGVRRSGIRARSVGVVGGAAGQHLFGQGVVVAA